MARDYVLPEGYKIKGTTVIFDLEDIYKFIIRWFDHYEWKWSEVSYKDSTRPDGGKGIEINLEAEKEFDNYITFKVTVDILIGAKEIDIEINGKQTKRMKGLIEFAFSAYLDKKEDKFGKGKFGHDIRRLYEKYILRSKVEDAQEALYRDIIELINEVKAFLNLHVVG